jgi:imidazoleglycerol-phosphate dehydratase
MRREKRRVAIKRRTRGTEVEIELRLDGSGRTAIDTPFGPLNELLSLMASHSGLDLRLVQLANRHADDPYAIDDLASGLAEGFRRAVGLRPRVRQFASAIVPVGDALVLAAIDLVSPPVFLFGATFNGRRAGEMDLGLIERFLATFIDRLGASLHLRVLAGAHEENRMRAIFIALGRCLSEASLEMERDGAREVALDLDYADGARRPPSGDEALDEAVIEDIEYVAEVDHEPVVRDVDEPRPRRGDRERGRSREGRESREVREPREGRESREVREPQEGRASRESARASREASREGREGSREGREPRDRSRPDRERGRRRELPPRPAPVAGPELEIPSMHLDAPVDEEFGELADLPDLADYPELQGSAEAIAASAEGSAGLEDGDEEGRAGNRRRRRGRRGGRGRRREGPEPAPAEAGASDALSGAAEEAAEVPLRGAFGEEEGGEEEEAFVPAYPRGRMAGRRDLPRQGREEPRRSDRTRGEREREVPGNDDLERDVPTDTRDRDERDEDQESFTPGPIDRDQSSRGGRDRGRRSADGSPVETPFGRGRKSPPAVRPGTVVKPVESLEPSGPFTADEVEEVAPYRPGARSRSPEETREPLPAEETDGVLDFISRPKETPAVESPRALARTRRRRR